jgi:hypothetical protein
MIKNFLVFPSLLLFLAVTGFSQRHISFKDKDISYEGRIPFTADAFQIVGSIR